MIDRTLILLHRKRFLLCLLTMYGRLVLFSVELNNFKVHSKILACFRFNKESKQNVPQCQKNNRSLMKSFDNIFSLGKP